jgi:hypothetical protein
MQIQNTDIVLKPSYLHEIYIKQQCNNINTTTFQNRYKFFTLLMSGITRLVILVCYTGPQKCFPDRVCAKPQLCFLSFCTKLQYKKKN